MVKDCKALGMKPVCDHPSYCKSDKEALYISQTHHMSHPSHCNNAAYMPSGFDTIKSKFKGMCYYTANHGGENALCNIPENTLPKISRKLQIRTPLHSALCPCLKMSRR